MLLYSDTPCALRVDRKKEPSIRVFFPATLLCPSTFTPAIHRKEGGGAVARHCDIQQKMSDFTVYLQSSFERY